MNMKSVSVGLILIALFGFYCRAQTVSDAFDSKVKIIWLGLDFTEAKLIGDFEHFGVESSVKTFMASLNELMSNEREKYDIAKTFEKSTVDYKLEICEKHNNGLKTEGMYSTELNDYLHLKPEDINKIAAGYDYQELHGMGLMFNIESFNKLTTQASMFVTFIDMDTKKVLFTERMTAEPSGFGIRNYWAGAVYAVMKNIEKKQ